MNARLLLSALRDANVNLKAEGGRLHVDAPAGALTETLRSSLVENKAHLIELLERERLMLEKARRIGFVARWSEYPTWIKLHDPLTGEWHEVKASECLPSIVEAASSKGRRRTDRTGRKSGGAA
jgi:hypothetical protein